MYRVLVFISLFCLNQVFAQHEVLQQYQEKYPNKTRVVLKDMTHLSISYNDQDSLDIFRTEEREIIYLDKNAGKYNKGSVRSSYFQELISIEAHTAVPQGKKKFKKVEVQDFEEKSVLDRMIFFDDSKTTFYTYPDVRAGAKTYVKYKKKLRIPELLSGSFFGDYSPVEYQEYRITHPVGVKLSFRKFNGVDSLTKYSRTEKDGIVTHNFIVNNPPELDYESSGPPLKSYAPMVYPIIESYQTNGQVVKVLGTIDDLHNWYGSLIKMQDYSLSEGLKNTADSLSQGLETEESIVKSIHQWVQSNIKYVAYEDGLGGFVPRSPSLVYERKFGDCKDMSTIQVAMAQHLGIEVNLGWVGTRDIPYTYDELPTASVDNHMIAMYKNTKGDWLVLDGTSQYTPFEYPSEFIQDKEVMVHLGEKEYEIVHIQPVNAEKNLTRDYSKIEITENGIKGKGKVSYTGYPLIDMKQRVLESDSIKRANYFKGQFLKGNNKFLFNYEGLKVLDDNLIEVFYSYEIQNYLSTYQDEIYLNLNLEQLLDGAKIDDDRKLPIVSDYESMIQNVYELNLGDYKISSLPKPLHIKNELMEVDLTYEEKDHKIVYTLTLKNTHLQINPDQFELWNDTIKKLGKKYKEVIVLKKAK